jgi:TolB-like protein
MQRKKVFKILNFVLFWIVLTSSSWAGQVVTKEVRLWAKKALEEEKALRLVEGRNTMAVLYFQNKTGESEFDPLQKGIPLLLIADLSNVKGLQVIERVKLQALVEEIGLGTSGLVEFNAAPRVGRLLGARWLIGGDISKGSIGIQSNLLDVPGQKVTGQAVVKGNLPELFRLEKDLLFEILKLLKIEVPPEEERELRKPCSTNIKALMALFKGIEASDRKDYQRAAEYYEVASREDPNICIVRGALQELMALKLIKANKRSRNLLRSLRDQGSVTDQLTTEDSVKRIRTPSETRPVQGESPYQ